MSDSVSYDRRQKLVEFLADKKVMVVDDSSTCRSSLGQVLNDLGAKSNYIYTYGNYKDAYSAIKEKDPDIIISDYKIGQSFGLDLRRAYNTGDLMRKDLIFILATNNSDEQVVAEAAEEEVSGFLVKPFNQGTLKGGLIDILFDSMEPNPYMQSIKKGKQLIATENYDEAWEFFESALDESETPSLARFYLGQIQEGKELWNEALQEYDEGLKFNEIHYKCLTASFDCHKKLSLHDKAYDILQKIIENYPLSPNLLENLLSLAVVTKHYEEIENFYDQYTTLEYRPQTLTKSMVAGLTVCGIYYLRKRKPLQSFNAMEKAVKVSGRDQRVLEKVIFEAINYQDFDHAEKYLELFDPKDKTSTNFKILDYIVMNSHCEAAAVVTKGNDLLKEEIHDQRIYQIMIARLREMGKDNAADDLLDEANRQFPDFQIDFSMKIAS